MNKRLWLINGAIVAAVVLAVAGTVTALTIGSTGDTDGLRTTQLGRGTVEEVVSASGSVTTTTNSTVNFLVSGRLDSVEVVLGQEVSEGDS